MSNFVEVRENLKEISEINHRATAELQTMGISVAPEQATATIAYVWLKNAAKLVAEKADATGQEFELNVFQLFDLGIDGREGSEDSEKDGNRTPTLQAGQELKLLMKSDLHTED